MMSSEFWLLSVIDLCVSGRATDRFPCIQAYNPVGHSNKSDIRYPNIAFIVKSSVTLHELSIAKPL